MSWSNFEELKKFARKNENVKKKRPASSVGWHNPSARKRRQTNDESLSFVSNVESTSEIDGFSTDEEKDEELLDYEIDSISSNLSKPCVKRTYSSKRRIFSDKRSSSSEHAGCCSTYAAQTGRKLQDDKSCNLMPDGANELMQCSEVPRDDEIVWCASDDEELSGVAFYDRAESEDTDSLGKVLTKHPITKSCRGKALTNETSTNTKPSGVLISDFQSDHESSQESFSADVSTPTPTPVSPVVVRTPKTASEWLKQVQEKSPQKSEQDQSPDGKGVCDSAKKKRKFLRSGLAEQLQHVISRDKSEKAFWNHRITDTEKKQTSISLLKEGSLVVQILSDQLQGSVHLTQCVLHNDEMSPDPQKTVFVLFSCDTWKQLSMQVGAIVNIHPPWQKLDIAGCPWPVLLCTYFCERQQTTADQSFDVLPQCVRAGLFIPFMHTSPSSSSLVQSPSKGFKPSKLLFGDAEDESKELKMTAPSSLTTKPEDRPADSKPQTSILTAIESCGGFSGALVTFQCMVQRVYCKKAKVSNDKKTNYRCSLLNQDLKSVAKSSKKPDANEEIRWALLVQDIHGMCAEIQVPRTFQDSLDWHSCFVEGEGKIYTFSRVKVIQRTNKMRSAGLFSLIQSVCCSNGHDTVSCDNGNSQIVTQESQISSITSPPNFCYVLALHESSQVSLCQDAHVSCEGFLYKPCVFKTLCDVHHADRDIEPQRISTSCKLLYCRFTGLSADSSFELFVTDSSLQNVPESEGRSQELLRYVKIVGKTSHVLPLELRETQTNCGLILSAKHLLLRVRASHELFADAYSVIRKAVPPSVPVTPSLFHEEYIQQDIFDSLTSLGPACLPCLSLHSSPGYIYLIEGVVTGVDEETACCWLVCDTCENRDISTISSAANSQFFCSSCNRAVESPQTRTHLAVFVKVKSFPEALVNVLLQQGTIDKLLPVSYQDSDQGHDIEALLDKQLQPMICYVRECSKQQHGSMATSSFNLEQIPIHYQDVFTSYTDMRTQNNSKGGDTFK